MTYIADTINQVKGCNQQQHTENSSSFAVPKHIKKGSPCQILIDKSQYDSKQARKAPNSVGVAIP
jgi:hypothetical protein